MSLSSKVNEHLNNASSELRNALWHAARNEKPATINQLAELLNAVDKIATVSDILEHLDDMKRRGDTKWTDFES